MPVAEDVQAAHVTTTDKDDADGSNPWSVTCSCGYTEVARTRAEARRLSREHKDTEADSYAEPIFTDPDVEEPKVDEPVVVAAEAVVLAANREQWLQNLVAAVRDHYSGELPDTLHLSVGFPSKGIRSKSIGECWMAAASDDECPHVFVHPRLKDPVEVAAVVVHELIHACRPEAKHGKDFKELALRLGLTGKMTATVPGDAFLAWIAPVLEEVGPYPHASLSGRNSSAGPKQQTYMLKVQCGDCGYTVRTTQKWLEIAVPSCPVCEIEMSV